MPEDFAKIATSKIYWRVIAVIDKFSDGKKGELLGWYYNAIRNPQKYDPRKLRSASEKY